MTDRRQQRSALRRDLEFLAQVRPTKITNDWVDTADAINEAFAARAAPLVPAQEPPHYDRELYQHAGDHQDGED